MNKATLFTILIDGAASMAAKIEAYDEFRHGLKCDALDDRKKARKVFNMAVAKGLKSRPTGEARKIRKSLARVREKRAQLAARLRRLEPDTPMQIALNGDTLPVSFLRMQDRGFLARIGDDSVLEVPVYTFVEIASEEGQSDGHG